MQFLLRLPEPLIPFSIYDKLINIAMSSMLTIKETLKPKVSNNKFCILTTLEKEREEKLYAFKPIIQELPSLNQLMLEVLADFLDTLTRDADDNMMTADNLAICFAPGLMRREVEELTQLMKESPFVNEIVAAIIDQYGFFFRVNLNTTIIIVRNNSKEFFFKG